MHFHSSVVKLWPGKLFGYNFHFIPEPGRSEFMRLLKETIPMKMWDYTSKRWWIPDLYTPIAENVALQFGALTKADLVPVAALRDVRVPALAIDYVALGLQPGMPLRLVEMTAAFWRIELAQLPIGILEAQEKEAAWLRIKGHFEAAADRV